jgi:ribonuclease BN (tRNA processing enzyme)
MNAPMFLTAGVEVTTQLARAGARPSSLRHVFITHHHSDHNAEYGALLLSAWGVDCELLSIRGGRPRLRE